MNIAFLDTVLGINGSKAIQKAVEKNPSLANIIVPRVLLSWVNNVGAYGFEGRVPGAQDTFLVLEKNENGLDGAVTINEKLFTFNGASSLHVAASIGVAIDNKIGSIDSLNKNDVERLGQSIDALVKTNIVRSIQQQYVQNLDYGDFVIEFTNDLSSPYLIKHEPTGQIVIDGLSKIEDAKRAAEIAVSILEKGISTDSSGFLSTPEGMQQHVSDFAQSVKKPQSSLNISATPQTQTQISGNLGRSAKQVAGITPKEVRSAQLPYPKKGDYTDNKNKQIRRENAFWSDIGRESEPNIFQKFFSKVKSLNRNEGELEKYDESPEEKRMRLLHPKQPQYDKRKQGANKKTSQFAPKQGVKAPPKPARTVVYRKKTPKGAHKGNKVKVNKGVTKKSCSECGDDLFKNEQFTACMCLSEFKDSIYLEKAEDGFYLNFSDSMLEEDVAAVFEIIQES